MKRSIKYYRIIWLRHDLPAGLTVFLVALPLCLGIALASGAPLYAGLVSGIVGGLLVSLLSGSQLAVSGPAAGLTTLVAATLLTLGDYRLFCVAVIIAGLFQLVLGVVKLGSISNYFPSAVIKGMLAAIGVLLVAKQIPLALGYDKPDFWTSGFINLFTSGNLLSNIHDLEFHFTNSAILISLVSLAILIFYERIIAKKSNLLPAPLLVVLVGVIIEELVNRVGTSTQLTSPQLVSIPADFFSGIVSPDFSQLFANGKIWEAGILIGLLASLETLLCIEAVDKLDKRNRITPVNRELIAQGIGNMVCGFLGALPITAVVVRGAANVDAGARSKFSSFTHGLFLLLAVVFFPMLLNKIPYASLAAILLVTGYNLTKPKLYKHMWTLGSKQFLPFAITVIVILLTDLLIGVSIGLLVSLYFIIQNNFKAEYKISQTVHLGIETYIIQLNSNVTFLNKVKLRKALDSIPEYSNLTIDGSQCNFVDFDILETISEFKNKAHDRHITLNLIQIQVVNISALH